LFSKRVIGRSIFIIATSTSRILLRV